MNFKKEVLKLSSRMRLISLERDSLTVQARYGPSNIIRLPLKINEDLAYFVAMDNSVD